MKDFDPTPTTKTPLLYTASQSHVMAFKISSVKNGVIGRSALPRAKLIHFSMHVSFQYQLGGLLIGAGIQVLSSPLVINSGMGAHLTVDAEVDSVVSVCDGWLVLRALIPRVGEFRNVVQWLHCMTIQSTDFTVLGFRDPVVGKGAGLFVNHCQRLQNVIAVNATGRVQWD